MSQEPYYQYPGTQQPPPAPRRGGCGCWFVGLVTLLIFAGLVSAALLLPPFNLGDQIQEQLLGPQYAMLDSQNNAAANDALTVIVDPADPGTEFGISLAATTQEDFAAAADQAEARAAIPPYLALQSGIYTIETTGDAPETTTLTLNIPPNAPNTDVLDLYAWDGASGEWQFLPAQIINDGQFIAQVEDIPGQIAIFQAAPLPPIVLTKLDIGQQMRPQIADVATIVAPAGMMPALPTANAGTLVGNPSGGFNTDSAYLVLPYIRNYSDPRATDPATVTDIISNSSLRADHIRELTLFASAGNYNGVFIDYRDLDPDQRENFSAFIAELAASLDEMNLSLGVSVPAAQNIDGIWQTFAYDWQAIGTHADYFQINLSLDPTTYTPGQDRLVEAMLRWAVGEVSRYKILGGMSARSLRQVSGEFVPISYQQALAPLGDVEIEVGLTEGDTVEPGSELRISLDGFDALTGIDNDVQSPFIDYLNEDGNPTTRMWLTTSEALRFRMDRLGMFGVGGVAFTDLLAEGVISSAFETIVNYKLQLPTTQEATELLLNWRIENATGYSTEFTSGLGEEIVVTLDAPDGNYAVNVEIEGGEIASVRSGAAVALFAPTATPTPLPTATPTLTPTPTPTLVPIVPTATPVPTVAEPAGQPQVAPPPANANPAPVAPGAGSIGALEIGGHVTNASSGRAINAMRNAGMTWMKVQIPWGVGGGTGSAQAAIEAARGNGFKILLGIVGDPGQLASGGGNYIREYAAFVGSVATLGPDAIEVWNEPNLSREWPEGQISGGNYTALLREAYLAIKAANPNVMVIGGAPAPTGAEGAFPGRVMNDDNFIRQMVEAGGLEFMDCMGMHYNEGIVSPFATSGDFRDNYYTRYLPTLLDTYWNLIGGARPICITELGYLSPEGYPPLPDFFSWAQNVTVAQQAAWLAEAAAYSAQSGRVQLMIVWNVDFQNYDQDPMAGFAIIRPDGSCPACNTLAAAR